MSEGPDLRLGDEIVVEIEKGVFRGLGLARHDGRVVFVARALPGDRLRVRVTEVSPGFTRAVSLERLAEGPGRRVSPCAVSDRCGGCAYQEVDYGAQLELKASILRESLARAKAPFAGPIDVVPSPETGWRSRATLHARRRGAAVSLGFHAEHSHDVVEFEQCLQLSPTLNRAVAGLRAAIAGRPQLSARLEGVDLAESSDGSRRIAALSGRFDPAKVGAWATLAREVPDLGGLGFLSGRGPAGRYLPVTGPPFLNHVVMGRGFRVHVRSFFQANRFLVEDLARTVSELLAPGGRVLDLYSGVGLFALGAASTSEEVVGIEANETAVADASANAREHRNVRFLQGDVGEALAAGAGPDCEQVILDPPRSGAGLDNVAAIVARKPQAVIYVSCDPPTLGRDLAAFGRAGYEPDFLRAFDMFPDTFHLETVVRIRPR